MKGWLIDNDLPCWDCPAYGQPPAASCDTCIHRREGEAGAFCGLTKLALPYAEWCCHHNASVNASQIAVALDDLAVAPWLLAVYHAMTPAELLADHHSAPELELRDKRAWLRLDELAVPFVYGVTADAWEAAVAMPEPEPIPDAPPHFAAALEALEALQAGGDVAPAYARLIQLLDEMPLASLPEYWRGTVAETLNLLKEHYTP
ncbi:hypothetical protein [Chloroflexus sp.]|uniref:hypothetical protein n=1 Tax=Chloroflexus sp. TaxID=1904827 RepID=UPI002ACE36E5|nr:hypothetical protein [Chloroflexus sp.]